MRLLFLFVPHFLIFKKLLLLHPPPRWGGKTLYRLSTLATDLSVLATTVFYSYYYNDGIHTHKNHVKIRWTSYKKTVVPVFIHTSNTHNTSLAPSILQAT